MVQGKLFGPILDMLIETMPRDNLLNSACLEFFDFIKRENIKTLIAHLVENHREKMKQITYVDIFSNFMIRYDQTSGFAPSVQTSFADTEDDTPKRPERGSRWGSGIKDLDAAEEEYFNTSDDEGPAVATIARVKRLVFDPEPEPNGDSPSSKRLVDYASDEEQDNDVSAGIVVDEAKTPESSSSKDSGAVMTPTSSTAPSPPERLSEKRRREEDEEDDMSKLAQQPKRRNSTTSNSSSSSLKKKKSFTNSAHGGSKGTKIAISLSPAIKSGGAKGGEEGGT